MGYRLNSLDGPVFIAVSKPLLTGFGIHHRLESFVSQFEPVFSKNFFSGIKLNPRLSAILFYFLNAIEKYIILRDLGQKTVELSSPRYISTDVGLAQT